MPRVYCRGTSVEIPENGKICPKLPTSFVPAGYKCNIVCGSGSPSVEDIKCEAEGWDTKEVACTVSTASPVTMESSTRVSGVNMGAQFEASTVNTRSTLENGTTSGFMKTVSTASPVTMESSTNASSEKIKSQFETTTVNFENTRSSFENATTLGNVKTPGTPTGLIVGLLVGGFIVVGLCIIAYIYARKKMRKKAKENNTKQPVSRADLVVTGVVTNEVVQAELVHAPQKSATQETQFRHQSGQNLSNPPLYDSSEQNDEGNSSTNDGQSGMIVDGQHHNAHDNAPIHREKQFSYNRLN